MCIPLGQIPNKGGRLVHQLDAQPYGTLEGALNAAIQGPALQGPAGRLPCLLLLRAGPGPSSSDRELSLGEGV